MLCSFRRAKRLTAENAGKHGPVILSAFRALRDETALHRTIQSSRPAMELLTIAPEPKQVEARTALDVTRRAFHERADVVLHVRPEEAEIKGSSRNDFAL